MTEVNNFLAFAGRIALVLLSPAASKSQNKLFLKGNFDPQAKISLCHVAIQLQKTTPGPCLRSSDCPHQVNKVKRRVPQQFPHSK